MDGALLDRVNQLHHLLPFDQIKRLSFGEGLGLLGEHAGGDNDGSCGLVSIDEAKHLPGNIDSNLQSLPLFTLYQKAIPVLSQPEVHSTVCACAFILQDQIPLAPECLPDQFLELLP